jgi:hypothetical protein
MTDELRQLDGIEQALLELEAAEQAGLFQRTRIDTSGLLAEPVPVRRAGSSRMALRLLPVAAAVCLAVGLWTMRPGTQTDLYTPNPTTTNSLALSDSGACDANFSLCLGGPSDGVQPTCMAHDYDADGDVDLADFRAYQLAYVRPSQTH